MKTLTKIKLINWHGFYDEILDVKGAVLFTGDNGCGKSTIIDALCFLLTGGEENKFNTAANFSAEVNQKLSERLKHICAAESARRERNFCVMKLI